jgi:hypothetical protein
MSLHPSVRIYLIKSRISWILFKADTSVVRFWFSIATIIFGITYLVPNANVLPHHYMEKLASHRTWGFLFLVNGLSMIYAVMTRRYDKILLILEGVLGFVLWVSFSTLYMYFTQSIVPAMACAFISFWLLLRYPTHWEYTDGS